MRSRYGRPVHMYFQGSAIRLITWTTTQSFRNIPRRRRRPGDPEDFQRQPASREAAPVHGGYQKKGERAKESDMEEW